MANVFDVAEFFVQLANESEDDQMTNLKLNKLLYYAQGAYLARTGRPLFHAQIEAWRYGPVIPEIYQKYRVCGKNPISSSEVFDREYFQEDELEVLLDVMREFGQYTGSKLVTLTHMPDTPWSEAVNQNQKVLEIEKLKNYFQQHPVARFQERITVPIVEKLPADWYDPYEDAEWEAYL